MRWHTFEVRGDPVAQGSKRALVNRHTGKAVVIEMAGARLKTWRQDVIGEARRCLNGQGPIEGPVAVHVHFYMRTPKKPKNLLPITRPDADKMLRGLLDALQAAGMFHDDAQVTSLVVKKRYAYDDTPYTAVSVGEES
jgi:Holliday junction resolvase RusA-like endonuclease